MNSHFNEFKKNMGIAADETVDLRSIMFALWENRILFMLVTGSIIILALLYTSFKTPMYEANALIQIQSSRAGGIRLSDQLTGMRGESDSTANQRALIRSRFILEPVIQQLGLGIIVQKEDHSIIAHNRSNDIEHLVVNRLDVPPYYYGKPLTLVVTGPKSYKLLDPENEVLLTGELDKIMHNDSGLSILVSSLPATIEGRYQLTRQSSADTIGPILSRLNIEELGDGEKTGILQISFVDSDPARLVQVLNAITHTIQAKDKERKSRETSVTLSFLKAQIPLVKASLEQAETALNRYRASTGKLDIKFESQQLMLQLTNLEKLITESHLAKATLLQKYTEKHPAIMGINEKIRELKEQKRTLIKEVSALPASDQVAVGLMRDVKVQNNLYLILLAKIQELQVTNAGTLSDVRILSNAVIPSSPLPKQTPVIVAASTVLGMILSSILILMRKAFFRRVNDPHWLEQHYGLPNLAILPYCKQQMLNSRSFSAKATPALDILAQKDPKNLSIEALRSLRTHFQIMLATAANNIVSITGPSPGIGKSFVSVNFSYLLADAGKRVLLIDADIRKGHLNDYFKVKRSYGLAEVIAGSLSINEAIHTTECPTLHFMSCGAYPQNPSELLMDNKFKNLLASLAPRYDLIVIDTAPVLAVTDSTIIGSLAGTNLLVLGSDVHQPEELNLTVKRLQAANVQIQGTVFNILKKETSIKGNFKYNYSSDYESVEPEPSQVNL